MNDELPGLPLALFIVIGMFGAPVLLLGGIGYGVYLIAVGLF
jgi:hypothetical protein